MKRVGVLGGLGPKATIYLMDMILEDTHASCDQENIDMIVSNHCTVPDRTAYILDSTKENPAVYLAEDARMLESCGCGFLIMPCNTSHYMYDEIQSAVSVPILNMPRLVCARLNADPSVKKVGIMATTGTIAGKVYDRYLEKEAWYAPSDVNDKVMYLIYDRVKKGLPVTKEEFYEVADLYFAAGCDALVTGCTELSVILRDNGLFSDKRIVDSTKVLAEETIRRYFE